MRHLVLSIIAWGTLLSGTLPLASAASARPLDQVVADGHLRVAVYDDNAPFSAMQDGKPVGIDVDIAEAIAKELKLALDLRVFNASENVDGDLRLNLWRGDLAGSQLADVMLHVPTDKLFALRNEQVFMTRPYFDQHLALAWRRSSSMPSFDSLEDIEDQEVAVEGASAADLMLMMAEAGRYRKNLKHFKNFDGASKAFLTGEAPILAGTRAGVEASCYDAKLAPEACPIKEIALGGLVKSQWDIGAAVRSDSRDLGYAIGEALAKFAEDGTLKTIFANYGVTFAAPKGY